MGWNISVIGAGTMGHGIAQCFALHGHQVQVYEGYQPILQGAPAVMQAELELMAEMGYLPKNQVKETLARIAFHSDLEAAVRNADYVIEAIVENLEEKVKLFALLEKHCKKDAVLASNTSSFRLKEMAREVSADTFKRMMVCHWYNPAHLMPLVELSCYGNMPEQTFQKVEALYEGIDKKTIKVLKDVSGMVANNLQHSLARQAFALIDEGVCSPEAIDKALMYSSAFRYVTTGLLEAADMGGLDIWYETQKNILPQLAQNTVPSAALKNKVEEGKLGLKTGEGFFKYSPEQAAKARDLFQRRLILQLMAIDRSADIKS